MELFTAGICFLLGLVLIVKGGDWFLDGAVWIAEVSGVPRFIVGATVVSLATTLPELPLRPGILVRSSSVTRWVSVPGMLNPFAIGPWPTR